MWGWLASRTDRNKPIPVDPSLAERIEAMGERMKKLQRRVDEMEVQNEEFVARVAKAAKRAYKAEYDVERKAAQDDVAADPNVSRAAQKAVLRARLRASNS